MIYLRNRYYESNTGRFITEDPAKDGTNWYAYAGNNPVMFVDPWGLRTVGEIIDEEKDKIQSLQNSIYSLDLNTYEGEELSYRIQDEIESSYSNIAKLSNSYNLDDEYCNLSVPMFCQSNTDNGDNLCWATCASMWVSYVLNDSYDRTGSIAKLANCYTENTWFNAFRALNIPYYSQAERKMTLNKAQIKDILDNGSPFAVLYRGQSYGHYVLVIGYEEIGNKMNIIYNDPATGTREKKSLEDFRQYSGIGNWKWTVFNK